MSGEVREIDRADRVDRIVENDNNQTANLTNSRVASTTDKENSESHSTERGTNQVVFTTDDSSSDEYDAVRLHERLTMEQRVVQVTKTHILTLL